VRLLGRAWGSNRADQPSGHARWARALPTKAQVLVYQGGKFLTKLQVDGSAWTIPSIEARIRRDLGPGRYTLMPHYGGRLHAARHFHVSDLGAGDAR
jgi:hypothetical protein